MADDQTNPFTVMGMMGMMQPNKYIDPAYKDKPLPIPGFMGTPTDAQGKPIQSYLDAQAQHDAWQPPAAAAPAQGTTLNSGPSNAAQMAQAMGLGPLGVAQSVNPNSAAGMAYAASSGMAPPGYYGNSAINADKGSAAGNWTPAYGGGGGGGMPQQAPAAAPAPTNPVDMRQAYLTALSNPGKVTTPGATVSQAPPLGQPSVMDSFLAAHPGGGGTGAGNYNNTGFFDTLNKLRSA